MVFAFCVSLNTVDAQQTYRITGEIGISSANHIWILNVKTNNDVLLRITPQTVDPYYLSRVSSSNLTEVSFDAGRTVAPSGYGYVNHGLHTHNFVAKENGTYLLDIWTDSATAFNYTIKSESHPLVYQEMLKSSKNLETIGFSESNNLLSIFWSNSVAPLLSCLESCCHVYLPMQYSARNSI